MVAALPREHYELVLETINECLEEGFPFDSPGGGTKTARAETARRLGLKTSSMNEKLHTAETRHGLRVDLSRFRPQRKLAAFSVEAVDDGEPDAEALVDLLAARHAKRKEHHDAAKVRNVRVFLDGPIGISYFGDPHVDDPGCAWGDLKRDVELCRDTKGMFGVNVGDSRNNWVGRLAALYAHQEVTSRQSLQLIEWLFTQIPWLMTIGGNHDKWGDIHGDAGQVIHRLRAPDGIYENDGCRMRVMLPSGCEFIQHVRHDFPGNSQFNPGHAFVRQTLFDYRDHVLVAGHRHKSGYIPIWHNDPQRLCQGIRVGTYKDLDHYASEKGFKEENWARSMGIVINPDLAHDPVRYIKTLFSIEEAAEYLTWRRNKFELGYSAA